MVERSLYERVKEFYLLFPEASNEQLYQMFPNHQPQSLRSRKSQFFKEMEIQALRAQVESPLDGLVGLKDTLPDDLPVPTRDLTSRIPQIDYDELPEPTNRVWYGEEWRINKFGSLDWYTPPRLDLSYAHWYEVFYLNEFNFPQFSPIGECHREWGAILDSGVRKAIFLCPRDHFKSSFCNNGYITFNICEHERTAQDWTGILNIAWDNSLALANMLSVSQNLLANPLILDFYGYLIDENRPNKENLKYFKFQPQGARPGFKTAGFKHGSITGMHPHLVMLDDIQDEPLSKDLMRKFQIIIDNKLIPAVGRHGRLIATGTHKGFDETNDGYLWLQTKPTFEVFKYPAIIGDLPPLGDISYEIKKVPQVFDGKVQKDYKGRTKYESKFIVYVKHRNRYKTLYPERYQIEDLMEKYLELSKSGRADTFYSEYLLIPSNSMGRFFKKERIRPMSGMPFPEFHDLSSFMQFKKKRRTPAYLWVDPGGKGSHGITLVVVAKHRNCWLILDMVVVREGILNATKVMADLIDQWGVRVWGVEGNFLQREAFGYTMSRYLKEILKRRGKMSLYSAPRIKDNQGDKIQRIREGLSIMLGIEGMPYTFFVNQRAHSYQQFDREVSEFGLDIRPSDKHEFDILDSIVSCDTFCVGMAGEPIWATA
jgi:hypothetical protein